MLLIAGVMMGLFSFMSIGQIQAPDYTFNITALGISREGVATTAGEVTGLTTVVPFVVSILAALMSLIAIFLFGNMRHQKRVALMAALFTAAVCVIIPVTAYGFASDFSGSIGWSSLVCAPFIAVIADLTAWRLISADQKKLRAADRLR